MEGSSGKKKRFRKEFSAYWNKIGGKSRGKLEKIGKRKRVNYCGCEDGDWVTGECAGRLDGSGTADPRAGTRRPVRGVSGRSRVSHWNSGE